MLSLCWLLSPGCLLCVLCASCACVLCCQSQLEVRFNWLCVCRQSSPKTLLVVQQKLSWCASHKNKTWSKPIGQLFSRTFYRRQNEAKYVKGSHLRPEFESRRGYFAIVFPTHFWYPRTHCCITVVVMFVVVTVFHRCIYERVRILDSLFRLWFFSILLCPHITTSLPYCFLPCHVQANMNRIVQFPEAGGFAHRRSQILKLTGAFS